MILKILPLGTFQVKIQRVMKTVILDAEGKGHYVGCVLNIDNFDASNQEYTWPGEGDDMFFIDGEEWPPSIHGTGTEDYFNAAWGFPSGEYAGPYHGVS
ncbi:DUF2961 domain-containing protein [Robertmurraya sp. P23]|uniref:DUF2961 domain-containing protein n=1 Tax=Robertmurraya sp. P23 TaxID=3436931 RepID=UPI003D97E2A1